MNRLYLLSWYYQAQAGESDACDFFEKLRAGKGLFPFDCPYQVSLVHCSVDEHWAVGILVMRGTMEDDSVEQNQELQEWFRACSADSSGADKTGMPAVHPSVEGTLQALYGSHHQSVETFGTL